MEFFQASGQVSDFEREICCSEKHKLLRLVFQFLKKREGDFEAASILAACLNLRGKFKFERSISTYQFFILRLRSAGISMGKVRSNRKVRGRYHQSVIPYEENLDMLNYILGRTLVARKVASAGEAFNSPTVGSGKYMSVIAQQYIGAGSGNSSCGIGAELSVSPLSTLENLEAAPPVYGTPLKVDEEVLVMDEILESGNCSYSSQCQFAYGNEELNGPTRFSFKTKYEGQEGKSSPGTVSSTPCPKSHPVPPLLVAAASEYYGVATQPASPTKPEPTITLPIPLP
ncbi:hypothetical protein L6164_032557 [Bauhinia variegata]|uniref:Uncharacterized protein n=1 Tax=Bauhinia variegata TaxID=167791 RepID=A0ACB9KP63_BAUVA|nr:hypothetical protein L6164_032557 [Bauhinia variegata]